MEIRYVRILLPCLVPLLCFYYQQEIRSGFCRTRSLSNATFPFLITWRSSSSKSAAVYKISWISDDFSQRLWRYIDFQNGGRPPSWNCFTTIRDHSRTFCCWPQLPVKFHVNLIDRSEDIAIWIFRILAWNAYSGHRNPRLLSYQL